MDHFSEPSSIWAGSSFFAFLLFFSSRGLLLLVDTAHLASSMLTKAEAIASNLFGPATEDSRLEAMLGDYLAVATDSLSLYPTPEKARRHIGTHAGLTEDEMRIPLVAVEM